MKKAINCINKDLLSILLNFGADPNFNFFWNIADKAILLEKVIKKYKFLHENNPQKKTLEKIINLLLEADAAGIAVGIYVEGCRTVLGWEEFTTTDLLKSSETKSSSCLMS